MITGKIFSIDGREDIVDNIMTIFKKHDNETLKRGNVRIDKFSDGEMSVCYGEYVRGMRVFLVCSTYDSDKIIKLNLAIDAAVRASAKEIVVIIPYFGYARQDRKDGLRGALGAKVIMNMLVANGMDRLITIDLHADQIQGFANLPIDHISGYSIFKRPLEKLATKSDNLVICSPDAGGVKRASVFQKRLIDKRYESVEFAMLSKMRKKPNQVDRMDLIGDVKDKDVIIIDDMVDTAGTLCKAAGIIKDAGAKSVNAFCTHAVLSGPAYDRLGESVLDRLYISNSLPLKQRKDLKGVKEITSFDKGLSKIILCDASRSISGVIYAIMKDRSYYEINEKTTE